MKLSQWAKKQGLNYRTAWNMVKSGKLAGAYTLPTGTIMVREEESKKIEKEDCVVTYARVSSSENKDNLLKQSQRLIDFCHANGWTIQESIREIGSGLNDSRKKLMQLLERGNCTKLIVEHKDRLTRFGFNYIKLLCEKTNCELIILNNADSAKEDLIQDFVSVITSFCARIYGQRRSKRKTEKLIKDLQDKQ